jgi:hypothetical protein
MPNFEDEMFKKAKSKQHNSTVFYFAFFTLKSLKFIAQKRPKIIKKPIFNTKKHYKLVVNAQNDRKI